MIKGGFGIDTTVAMSSSYIVQPSTDEQKQSAIKNVLASPYVENANEAATVLQALGLIPYKAVNQSEEKDDNKEAAPRTSG